MSHIGPLRTVACGLTLLILLSFPPALADSSFPLRFPLDLRTCKKVKKGVDYYCTFSQDFRDYNSNPDYKSTKNKYHTGIDIAAQAEKTNVYPVGSGRIAIIQRAHKNENSTDNGLGNTIIVYHKRLDDYSQYSHLHSIDGKYGRARDLNALMTKNIMTAKKQRKLTSCIANIKKRMCKIMSRRSLK